MEINALIKDYFKQQGYPDSLAEFDHETNTKIMKNQQKSISKSLQVNRVPKSQIDLQQMPLLYTKFIEDKVAEDQEPPQKLT